MSNIELEFALLNKRLDAIEKHLGIEHPQMYFGRLAAIELRNDTGFGIYDCNRVLTMCDGDEDEARRILHDAVLC